MRCLLICLFVSLSSSSHAQTAPRLIGMIKGQGNASLVVLEHEGKKGFLRVGEGWLDFQLQAVLRNSVLVKRDGVSIEIMFQETAAASSFQENDEPSIAIGHTTEEAQPLPKNYPILEALPNEDF